MLPRRSYSITQLTIATTLLLAVSVFSYVSIYRMQESLRQVNRSTVVKLELQRLLSDFANTATAHRSFVYSGDPTFYRQYREGVDTIRHQLRKIKTLVGEHPAQKHNMYVLEAFSERRIAFLESQTKERQEILTEKQWRPTRRYFLLVTEQTDRMMAEEDRMMAERMDLLKQQEKLLPLYVVLLVVGSLMTLIIGVFLLTKETKRSRRLKSQLEETSEELERSHQELQIGQINRGILKEVAEKFSDYKLYNEFFQLLAQYISDVVKVDNVLIGKLMKDDGEPHIRTIAVCVQGQKVDNFTFQLKGSPSEIALADGHFICDSDCQTAFPDSLVLKMLEAESYVGVALYAMDGQPVGIISAMQYEPITQADTVLSIMQIAAKRAELELLRLENEEKLSQQNESLEQTNRWLSKLNKELEAFTYISSHDLQEPLRKIQIFISRILDNEMDSLSENAKNYMMRTQEAANRLQRLVQDLLAYSRLKSGSVPTERHSLRKLVDGLRNELHEELTSREAQLIVSGADDILVVESQFKQLLNNLIYNSLKFSSPDRAPIIEIHNSLMRGKDVPEEGTDPKRPYHCISVSDNGIGFDPQYRKRIFELFQRVHEESKFKGTGIGLSIVKKIVDNHNGIVTADSTEGLGTTFTIYLPAENL